MENEETEQREPENNKRIAGLTKGLEDRCNVLDCQEHWRCLDIDKPQRCALWRMTERDEAKRRERRARIKARQQQSQKTEAEAEAEKRWDECVGSKKKRGEWVAFRVRDNETKTVYRSMTAASKATGKSVSTIARQAQKPSGRFEYVNELGERMQRSEVELNSMKAKKNHRRRIRDKKTGKEYESIKAAARLTGIDRSKINYQLRRCKTPRFEYVDE